MLFKMGSIADVCVFCAPAAAKSLPRQRRRKSWSKLWRSWSFICRKRSGTRAASRQRSTLWNMPCAASDRWRVSNAFKLSLHKSSIMQKHLPGHRDIVLLSVKLSIYFLSFISLDYNENLARHIKQQLSNQTNALQHGSSASSISANQGRTTGWTSRHVINMLIHLIMCLPLF